MRIDLSFFPSGRWKLVAQQRAGHPIAEFADGGRRVTRKLLSSCSTREEGASWVANANRDHEDGADPVRAAQVAARGRSISDALDAWIAKQADRLREGQISAATYEIDISLAGRLTDYFGERPLAAINAAEIERYKTSRTASWATVAGELTRCLRPMLRDEARLGNFGLDPDMVCGDVRREYVPRTRYATVEQAWQVVRSYERRGRKTEKSRRMAFHFGTGARLVEVQRACWEDLSTTLVDGREVEVLHIRGSKTERSDRFAPVVPVLSEFVAYAFEGRGDKTGPMFPSPWRNMHRSLRLRGERKECGGRPLSPNDARRSAITWLCWDGVPEATVAGWLGTSAAMVRSVYAQHTHETRRLAAARAGLEHGAGNVPTSPVPPPDHSNVIPFPSRKAAK